MYRLCAFKLTDKRQCPSINTDEFLQIFGQAGETEVEVESYEACIIEQKQQWYERKWQGASMTYSFNALRSNDFRCSGYFRHAIKIITTVNSTHICA
jgi:hypothetical protein